MIDLAALDHVRMALLADTHGQLDPRVADDIRSCDAAVHAGDVGGARVLQDIQPRLGLVFAVRGNNDQPRTWSDSEHAALAELSEVVSVDLPGGRLIAVHGDRHNPAARRHQLLRHAYSSARAVVYGHSHRLACDYEPEPWILNPGAAGRVRTHGGPSFLILVAACGGWHVEARRFEPR